MASKEFTTIPNCWAEQEDVSLLQSGKKNYPHYDEDEIPEIVPGDFQEAANEMLINCNIKRRPSIQTRGPN